MQSEFNVYAAAAAARPAARPVKRKTRITIYLDDEVLEQFRSLSEQSGMGYQTLINAALRMRLMSARSDTATID
ncbi:MAG: BrnA antitoxin family protein [Pseudomonadota bacterium]